ncbi:MAG: NTP transferase domain-containing protein [Bdellovibrionota bacterium]
MKQRVCILAAGLGSRMGQYCVQLNKVLLPLGEKAIISHILSSFPADTVFVIALGFGAQDVKDYLALAHPDREFRFVEVDNFDRPGSGPGYSLLCCERELTGAFTLVCGDTLWDPGFSGLKTAGNWLAVSGIPEGQSRAYCNIEVRGAKALSIKDKEAVDVRNYRAFTGLARIEDSQAFFEGLRSGKTRTQGELQLANGFETLVAGGKMAALELPGWIDVGTAVKYQAAEAVHTRFDFGKTREYFYCFDGRVIKYFADEEIAKNRVERARLHPQTLPRITGARRHFYSYAHVPGMTFYKCAEPHLFSRLLTWLEKDFWKSAPCDPREFRELCRKFHHDKSLARIGDAERILAGSLEATVNGRELPKVSALLGQIPWKTLEEGVPRFIHGDLQFDNILCGPSRSFFKLIDWRQDFSGSLEIGDLYYDFAKLLTGIRVNIDGLKEGRFTFSEKPGAIRFEIPSVEPKAIYTEILEKSATAMGLEFARVRLMSSLILLNMSPLHREPFNKMFYHYGRQLLAEELAALKPVVSRKKKSA